MIDLYSKARELNHYPYFGYSQTHQGTAGPNPLIKHKEAITVESLLTGPEWNNAMLLSSFKPFLAAPRLYYYQ